MGASCSFVTCAVKKHGIEFCWDCPENIDCEKWAKHRDLGTKYDSFKTYQRLEADIAFVRQNGVEKFQQSQIVREKLLAQMLEEFNEGRSKSYYCIAATVLELDDLENALSEAGKRSGGLPVKEKSRILHSLIGSLASQKGYLLKLRTGRD